MNMPGNLNPIIACYEFKFNPNLLRVVQSFVEMILCG